MAYLMSFSPTLLWFWKIFADQNSLFIKQGKCIKAKILDEILQKSGPFGNLFTSQFERVNPSSEEAIVCDRIVISVKFKQLSNMF